MKRAIGWALWACIPGIVFFTHQDATASGHKKKEILRLATTTSTYETGLLDHIFPPFEKKHNVKIHIVSVGTGKAIKIAENGDVDVFVVPGEGGLDNPHDVAFGPDGNLYASSFHSDAILRFDGTSGALIDAFVPTGANGLDAPYGIAFAQTIVFTLSVWPTRAFSNMTLKSRMKAWRTSLLPGSSGRFIGRDLDRDIKNVTSYYRKSGYPDVIIDHKSIQTRLFGK